MKYIFAITALLFISCDSKFIRKDIEDGQASIKWYYYSYISNNSPDIIEIKKNDSCVEIVRAEQIIKDVEVRKETIFIKTYPFSTGIVYSDNIRKRALGYSIVIDSTIVEGENIKIPLGVKE